MRYYAQYMNNKLLAIGIGNGGVEITEEEYNRLLTEIHEKAALVDFLYNGEITIIDVPTEWQEEIKRRVDKRIATYEETDEKIESEETMNADRSEEDQ